MSYLRALAVVLPLLLVGCDDEDPPARDAAADGPATPDAATDAPTGADASADPDAAADAGMTSTCVGAGGACAPGDCCLGYRCGAAAVCEVAFCADLGVACVIDSDCCSLNCEGGTCGDSAGACGILGATCSTGGDCCSFNCAGTTCAGATTSCDPIGETCAGPNQCCSDFCGNDSGSACGVGDVGCRCMQATSCRAQDELCSSDLDCCNHYCDRPGGATVGTCAALGGCAVVGEPCGTVGINGSCCSNACVDDGSGVATCDFLGGCLPIGEACEAGAECCSGSCAASGVTADGRPILRCDNPIACLLPGEVCFTGASANCCPPGGGAVGCEPAVSGVYRCFGGSSDCVLPGDPCTTTAECCMDIPGLSCEPGPAGENICCLPDGASCAFGDLCCDGVCAPDPTTGALVCNPGGCVTAGGSCTADADCCEGCCEQDATGELVCLEPAMCAGCTDGQLGDMCGPTQPCCPGLSCVGVEFPTCRL